MKRGVPQPQQSSYNHTHHSNVDTSQPQQPQQPQQQHHSYHYPEEIGGNGPFVPLEETLHTNYRLNQYSTATTAAATTATTTATTANTTTTPSSNVITGRTSQHHHRQALSSSNSSSHATTTSSTTTAAAAIHHTTPTTNSTALKQTPTTNMTTNFTNLYHKLRHVILHKTKTLDSKKIISSTVFTLIFLLITDSLWSSPEHRVVPPNFANHFLLWVQDHPASGLIWILLVMSVAVVCMIPIGTPLTLGCGYIYKGAYGWQLGVLIATGVSMMGSALGAVICFLLGRYMMRDMVKKWIRKYPIFDAIDIAATEHGLRIMAMLYLTPILPLGPVSYMCGTTSLKLSHFIIAKIAALPLMMLYVLIGASTGTLIGTTTTTSKTPNDNIPNHADATQSIENNETLIISGILLSFASIAGITHYIKKELNHILERQKRELEQNGNSGGGGGGIECSHMTTATAAATSSSTLKDVESGTHHTAGSTTELGNNFIHILDSSVPNMTTTTATTLSSTPISKVTPLSSGTTSVLESDVVTTTAPRQRKH